MSIVKNFKIGDRVELLNTLGVDGVHVGDKGIIERIDEGSYKVRLDKNADFWWANDNDLKLVPNNPYDATSKEIKQFYDSMINVGFSEKRAWALVRILIRENAKK